MKNPYETALQLAREKLAAMDLSEVAFNSSALFSDDRLTVSFIGFDYEIAREGQQIIRLKDRADPKIAEKIIILHYLTTADGTPLSRQLITFENLPGANFYYPTYKARTIDLLLNTFNNNMKQFLHICQTAGAKTEPTDYKGKATFLVLPNVPVYLLYWSGEPEIPPNLQILYDGNITHYLPLEDIVVVTELLTHKIINQARLHPPEIDNSGTALYDYR